jgi:peptidoglycan/LPS O-acetylase OafA/YrhL
MSARGFARPAEIKALSGARALPAILIVAFHFCAAHRYVPFAPVLGPPVTKGYLWVEFFFALSGFLLVLLYAERPLRFGQFLQARLARLYPVHLVTLLSILALFAVRWMIETHFGLRAAAADPQLNTWVTFLANLFLVQAWNTVPGLSWNGMAWFVSVEFLLVLVFPVYRWLARGGAWRGAGLIAGGVAWLLLLEWNSGVGLDITFANGMFRGMADFAIGGGMALVFRATRDRPVPAYLHAAVQSGLVLFFVWALYFSGPAESRADIFSALATMALILVLAFDKGFLARLFQTAPLQKLGAWSYGIYMGQMFWMLIVRRIDPVLATAHGAVFGIPVRTIVWYGEPLVFLIVCVIWGALLTRFVERPALAYLRRHIAG